MAIQPQPPSRPPDRAVLFPYSWIRPNAIGSRPFVLFFLLLYYDAFAFPVEAGADAREIERCQQPRQVKKPVPPPAAAVSVTVTNQQGAALDTDGFLANLKDVIVTVARLYVA